MFKLLTVFSFFMASPATVPPDVCTTYSDLVSVTPTDWTLSVTIPKFDPALGILNSIEFELIGHIEGTAYYENFENMDADISLTLSASILLTRPDLSTLLTVTPSVLILEHPDAFDGAWDYDGDSGSTFAALSTDATVSAISPPPISDLVLFTGLGNIVLPISATANSTGSGPGNWIFGFSTDAGADVNVTYCYTPIPEPTTLALLLPGAIAAIGRRRR